ncbi:MAG: hypothetical protein HLUCCO16_07375 [Phormidium sp. OSCR]|nr:MAG: hypothetical protein HLUCCO16_07375 [Phormidium sp. OSCR]
MFGGESVRLASSLFLPFYHTLVDLSTNSILGKSGVGSLEWKENHRPMESAAKATDIPKKTNFSIVNRQRLTSHC